ncbi:4Fe-4S dicluster domain-containing protein, partial [Desulfovibrio sp. 1188_IL3213]|uniref:4Fe-4S dicluster domain-containing protein n=2 Tax=unclassified Desulfovibrio TaxID=2593640 RepID=UPI002FDAEA54
MTEHIQVVPDKCRACRRCEVACIAAHHGMSFKEAMKHRDELVSRVQVVKAEGFKTTVRCHQCPHAPCVNVCPTGALQQDEQGRIIMRVQYCVACKMCMAACPYGTITMETIGMPSVDGEDGETLAQRARREVAVRCDMCRAWRVENGKRITACMEACPAHALSLVLADGTVVEAPKPEKKAVPAAAGSENAAKAEASKAETSKAETAPAGTTPSAAEAAGAESQKLAPK